MTRYESQQKWKKAHPDKVREQNRRYRERHREKINELAREWQKNNKGKAYTSDSQVKAMTENTIKDVNWILDKVQSERAEEIKSEEFDYIKKIKEETL